MHGRLRGDGTPIGNERIAVWGERSTRRTWRRPGGGASRSKRCGHRQPRRYWLPTVTGAREAGRDRGHRERRRRSRSNGRARRRAGRANDRASRRRGWRAGRRCVARIARRNPDSPQACRSDELGTRRPLRLRRARAATGAGRTRRRLRSDACHRRREVHDRRGRDDRRRHADSSARRLGRRSSGRCERATEGGRRHRGAPRERATVYIDRCTRPLPPHRPLDGRPRIVGDDRRRQLPGAIRATDSDPARCGRAADRPRGPPSRRRSHRGFDFRPRRARRRPTRDGSRSLRRPHGSRWQRELSRRRQESVRVPRAETRHLRAARAGLRRRIAGVNGAALVPAVQGGGRQAGHGGRDARPSRASRHRRDSRRLLRGRGEAGRHPRFRGWSTR